MSDVRCQILDVTALLELRYLGLHTLLPFTVYRLLFTVYCSLFAVHCLLFALLTIPTVLPD